MKKEVKQERNIGVDIVRILATILVLTVHFFLNTNYYKHTTISGISLNMQTAIRNFCMSCVPLFMILTGFLNNKKEYNKSFFKKLLNILIIWLFYSVIELFVLSYLNKTYSAISATNLLYRLTNFEACKYSWYIEMYIGLYLLSPIINNGYNSLSDKDRKKVVYLITGLTILPLLINNTFNKIFVIPDYWKELYPITYYLVGKYIADRKFNFNKKTLIVLLFFTQLFTISYLYIDSIDFNRPSIFIQSILLFLLFYNINIKNNFIRKALTYISNISLDIYLASSLIDQIIYPLFRAKLKFDVIGQSKIIIYAPLILIIVFILSTIYGSIRKFLINIR